MGYLSKIPDWIESGVSGEIVPPPPKKLKAETTPDSESDPDTFMYTGRRFRKPRAGDPEYARQHEQFYYEFERSEGFEISWDKYDYPFVSFNWSWGVPLDYYMSNDDLVKMVTQYAIDEENQEEGTNVVLHEIVNVNLIPCNGFVFCISFWGKDLSLSNPELKRYQTKVWRNVTDDIEVEIFRLRPTDEEMAAVYVEPFRPRRQVTRPT
ncbi:PREDICTED: uncharacterized protein LOC104820431 [Tarenaya hassleriana]|uniref:uncharacterized protein LOC104820431 n=1 Tax=Tarenaya hassleriana TaxID=28532 RepID=UPI00053C4D6D|nr:PREDICTED: uncharacterized protein LOC104820431 [Tarenaya hassleriana]